MDGWYLKGVPYQFEPVHGLGRPVEIFPSRRSFLIHYGPLLIAVVAILAALATLGWGAVLTYTRYFHHGPAVIWRYLTPPVISGSILILISLAALLTLVHRWGRIAVLYEQGLAFTTWRGVSTWRWEEVSSVRSAVTQLVFLGKRGPISHEYVLIRRNGEKVVLDDTLQRVDHLAKAIRDQVTPLILARFSKAFENGQILHFGPVQLSLREGIRLGSHVYDWSQIDETVVQDGLLRIKLAPDGKDDPAQPRIMVSQVPNLDVLLSIMNRR